MKAGIWKIAGGLALSMTFFGLVACQQAPLAGTSGDAILTLDNAEGSKQISAVSLLARSDIQTIRIPDDVAYHGPRSYQALPLQALLQTGEGHGHLQFTATDGFVATIPFTAFQSGAKAWLAVEDAQHPWPALKESGPGAGPFYLVWTDPAAGKISNEQWPYQIARIALVPALEERYPQLLPKAGADVQAAALRGMQVFIRNCTSCHSLNRGGDAQLGPDLNVPMNPTEYFQETALRKLIRQPGSVRSWKQSVMPGFDQQSLPEADLDDLLTYLRQMAKQKAG